MTDPDIKAMAHSLNDMASSLTLAWSTATELGEEHVKISTHHALEMITRLNQIAHALTA
ncbi:hypothetical protein [Bradyrhizobium ottawaense]|uniref:hypothetical protein n=1 Tax=Bradyrhizobium ottawaense TaxID=931866 RepID=UPI0035112B6E